MCMIICLCIIVYITDTHHSAHPFTRAFRLRIIRNRIFTPSSGTCTGTLSRIPCLNHLSYNVIALFRTIAHVRSRNIAAILRAKNIFWCYIYLSALFECLRVTMSSIPLRDVFVPQEFRYVLFQKILEGKYAHIYIAALAVNILICYLSESNRWPT